jgi:hypothetical protein
MWCSGSRHYERAASELISSDFSPAAGSSTTLVGVCRGSLVDYYCVLAGGRCPLWAGPSSAVQDLQSQNNPTPDTPRHYCSSEREHFSQIPSLRLYTNKSSTFALFVVLCENGLRGGETLVLYCGDTSPTAACTAQSLYLKVWGFFVGTTKQGYRCETQ